MTASTYPSRAGKGSATLGFRREDFRVTSSRAKVIFGLIAPAILMLYAVSAWFTQKAFWPGTLFGTAGGSWASESTTLYGTGATWAGVTATGLAVFLLGEFYFSETHVIWRIADVLRLAGLITFLVGIVPLIVFLFRVVW